MTFYKDIDGRKILVSSEIEAVKSALANQKPAILVIDKSNEREDTSFARYVFMWDEALGNEQVDDAYARMVIARYDKKPLIIARTERLVIRELVKEDAKDLSHILSNESSVFFKDTFNDANDAHSILEQYSPMTYDIYGYGIYGIELEGEGIIGIVGFSPREDGDIELGYAVVPRMRQKGYGFEACKAVIEYAKDNIEYRSILINTDENNIAGNALKDKIRRLIDG